LKSFLPRTKRAGRICRCEARKLTGHGKTYGVREGPKPTGPAVGCGSPLVTSHSFAPAPVDAAVECIFFFLSDVSEPGAASRGRWRPLVLATSNQQQQARYAYGMDFVAVDFCLGRFVGYWEEQFFFYHYWEEQLAEHPTDDR